MSYLTELWIGTVVNVLDSISHVLGHPAVLLGPPWAYIGRIPIFAVFIQLGLHCNVIFNQINYSDCNKCFGQHLTCPRASWGPHRASSGLYWTDLNILQYLFNLDYIAMSYLTELWIGTVQSSMGTQAGQPVC